MFDCPLCSCSNAHVADFVSVDLKAILERDGTTRGPRIPSPASVAPVVAEKPRRAAPSLNLSLRRAEASQGSGSGRPSPRLQLDRRRAEQLASQAITEKEQREKQHATDKARLEEAIEKRLSEERAEAERMKRQEEDERLDKQRCDQESVDAASLERFLKVHGFEGIHSRRRSLMTSQYPLHTAVKLGDLSMIRVLLQAQADPNCTNSSGETPEQLADRLFRGDEALRKDVADALFRNAEW